MKTKKTILNFITDVIPLVLLSFLGIYKVKLFLQVLGSDTLGLYQLFNNVMVYVALVDGGLTSALLYSLYKPNSDGDNKKINELLSAGLSVFSKIGMYVFSIATMVSFFVIFLIKDAPFSYFYVVITFLLFALSNVIEYFFVPYNVILEVKEKKYLYNLITQIGQIAISIIEIILLLLGVEFAYILLSHSIVRLITKIIEVYVCKREFPWINVHEQKKDYSFKKFLNSLIFHKVNGLVGGNVDSIIISSFLGLGSVAIFSTYHYIINMLRNILGKIASSMTAFIGNSLEKDGKRMYKIFMEINSMLFFIAIVISIPLFLSINGFISMFYNGEIETSSSIALACSLVLFIYLIKMPATIYANAGGLYKETKHCVMIDTIVNLSLSIGLVFLFGIAGVLFATFLSAFISEYILKTRVIYRHIFHTSSKGFFLCNIKFFIIAIIDLGLCYSVTSLFTINNLFIWFLFFSILTIINAIVILWIFSLLGEIDFIERFKSLFRNNVNVETK